MATEYEKAHAAYREAAKAAENGDGQAKKAKVALMNDIRKIERDAARAGTVLSAIYRADDKIEVQRQETDSKRSLQEAYVRKFDNEKQVNIGGKMQTLRQYHKERLLGK